MTYQVLARKWRPKNFASIIGQEHVVHALTYALKVQRVHQAYFFTGTRGVGKTTLSRILAKALNCETGITAIPCGLCAACHEIDEGRFVDYVEMDAASNRGVDEMAVLLERAVYTPVNARFKIYMIDEVHMLTNHAFNSMLKTLEEPPEHVKFILATTDPQKIPATVLSRCLQFNLKQMQAGHIASHLEYILVEEGISFEVQALKLLSRAAAGSMRDALSLTDQAIAYSAGAVTERVVRDMLGLLDQTHLVRLLDAIIARDGATVRSVADEMASCSLSFSTALQDLSSLLHRIAWAHVVPDSVLDESPEEAEVRRFSKKLTPEAVQLYYQIATIGRSELKLAPDEYAGFTMALLRMLAFGTIDTTRRYSPKIDSSGAGSGAGSGTGGSPIANNVHAFGDARHQSAQSLYSTEAVLSPTISSNNTGSLKTAVRSNDLSLSANDQTDTDQIMQAEKAYTAMKLCTQSTQMSSVSTNVTDIGAVLGILIDNKETRILSKRSCISEAALVEIQSEAIESAAIKALSVSERLFIAEHQSTSSKDLQRDAASPCNAAFSASAAQTTVRSPVISVTPWDDVPPDDTYVSLSVHEDNFNVSRLNSSALTDNLSISAPDMSLTPLGYDGDWPTLAESLPLRGISYQLALHSELVACNSNELVLCVSVPQYADMANAEKLQLSIERVLDRIVRVIISVGPTRYTAAAVVIARRAEQQQKAEHEINTHPFIQTLIREFDATIVPGSIRPLNADYHASAI
ncbi:DNA polymerase III subunit gamma/tau [Candidatus Vallotia cooleyia]|nr:DNA polymerase III subunit gamma/tau [Candidatus Vallotia cooleyia]UDG81967.1 DNA polymerase III subunit gamma/tau [Candidatus Vallotia cooleyia]